MSRQTRYSPEVQDRAVRMVQEHQGEYASECAAMGSIAAKIDLEMVEFATLERVDWFNNRRLLESIGNIPPVELEKAYHRSQEPPAVMAAVN